MTRLDDHPRARIDGEFVPQVRSGVEVREFGTEVLAWSPVHPRPAFLDPVAAIVMQIVDGEATIDELTQDVHSTLDVPTDIASAQITRSIGLLDDFALLADSVPGPRQGSELIFHDPPNP